MLYKMRLILLLIYRFWFL